MRRLYHGHQTSHFAILHSKKLKKYGNLLAFFYFVLPPQHEIGRRLEESNKYLVNTNLGKKPIWTFQEYSRISFQYLQL